MKKYEQKIHKIIEDIIAIRMKIGEDEDEVTAIYLAGMFSSVVAILEIIKGGK